jgi:hypothetical protein
MNDSMSLYAPPTQDNAAPAPVDAPRQDGEKTMSTGYVIVLLGLGVFGVSMFLPAVKINIFKEVAIEGYIAFLMSFSAAVKSPLSIWPLLVFGNLWLLAMPLIGRSRRGFAFKAAIVTWLSAVCAAALPFVNDDPRDMQDDLMVGYYTWVASFVVTAIGATWVAIERSRARRLEELAA